MSQIQSLFKHRRLPSLHHLRAFEAAARHQSITLAAQELHVTQSAISHQVKALEEYLGQALFKRQGRDIVLTDAGKRYFPEIDAALDRMALATEELERGAKPRSLTINVTASMATRWLIPCLPSFCEQHPDLEVRLVTTEKTLDFNPQLFDVSIRCYDSPTLQAMHQRREWEGVSSQPFLDDAMFLVCSPRLLQSKPLNKPSDLRQHTLLHTLSAPEMWEQWLAGVGLPKLKPRAELTFDKFHLSLQAAARGLGVAIGSQPLTREELANGSLVSPFPELLIHDKHYHCLTPEKAAKRPEVAAFCQWLRSGDVQMAPTTSTVKNPRGRRCEPVPARLSPATNSP